MKPEIDPVDFNPKMEIFAAFVEYNGKFPLLLRHYNKPQGNTWCLPAGRQEPGEMPLDTLIRELREELGDEIAEKISKDDANYFTSVPIRHEEFDCLFHLFHIQLLQPADIKINPEEHKEYKWVSPQESLKLPLIFGEDYCIRLYYSTNLLPAKSIQH